MADRGNRDQIVVATKVGSSKATCRGPRPDHVAKAVRRLAAPPADRPHRPLLRPQRGPRDAARAHAARVRRSSSASGKVRHIGFSNHTAARIDEAIAIAEREGLARSGSLQAHYNLLERDYEGELAPLVAAHGLAEAPYFGLAKGFLTGKYRPGGAAVESRRAPRARRATWTIRAGSRCSRRSTRSPHDRRVALAAVALAWLRTRPGIVAPIASARTPEQLAEILPSAELELTAEEADRLTAAGQAAV